MNDFDFVDKKLVLMSNSEETLKNPGKIVKKIEISVPLVVI